jgi:cytoskeleton protein RodZ
MPIAEELAAAAPAPGRTGPFLRSSRESLGISLDDLSKGTRISTRYLEAIETDAFERLPSAIFVKGYLKQVVEQLDLDGQGIVEAFMAAYHARRG